MIFDEFLTNKNWEKDEYKALNEFCDNLGISYDVLAVSFFTNQVAVKLKKNWKNEKAFRNLGFRQWKIIQSYRAGGIKLTKK